MQPKAESNHGFYCALPIVREAMDHKENSTHLASGHRVCNGNGRHWNDLRDILKVSQRRPAPVWMFWGKDSLNYKSQTFSEDYPAPHGKSPQLLYVECFPCLKQVRDLPGARPRLSWHHHLETLAPAQTNGHSGLWELWAVGTKTSLRGTAEA